MLTSASCPDGCSRSRRTERSITGVVPQIEQRYLETLPPAETTWEPSLEIWLRETKALKAVHRACLIFRYVHGMDRAEIAQRLGLRDNQVKGYLQHALAILRRELVKTPR